MRNNDESPENLGDKQELMEMSKEIRIGIPMIMIENCKVKMQGELHYSLKGFNVKNEVKIFENVFEKIESGCDKGRGLHREERDMIQKDTMPQKENGARSTRLAGMSETMIPQKENGARSMRLVGMSEAMSPQKENGARSMRLVDFVTNEHVLDQSLL